MFKFFRKKTLTQSQEKTKRTEYVKDDLVLFSKIADVDVLWDYNAEKAISEDKQYFFCRHL